LREAAASTPGGRNVKYDAALFDFDGTLTPSLPLWVKAYHLGLRQFDIELTDAELIRRCFFREWSEVAAELHIASADELRKQVHLGLRSAFLEAQLFPLVPAVLRQCRAHGLKTALVTSSPREIVSEALPRLDLANQFDFVICGDDVANYKPHPEPVLTTLAALGRRAHEAIMIGDSRVDILAGKAAGTATALFLPDDGGGFHSPEALRATNPDYIFADHGELPALLGIPQRLR
jgi:pyrophosphatase PpaX